MNSRALRRLAADHGALHNEPLPPNYFFLPNDVEGDDLMGLNILLAGPCHTPFAKGVFKLHLTIPTNYPQQAPTAHFRTPIFHPNVDPQTGGVCVETLKRDWDAKLTLRDILIVIGCLLIQPNPDSALNAEAGALIQEDYDAYSRRAELMTSIHASVPHAWQELASEAQNRGGGARQDSTEDDLPAEPAALERRRRPMTRRNRAVASRTSETSPSAALGRRRRAIRPAPPFVLNRDEDDVFRRARTPVVDAGDTDDESMKIHEDGHSVTEEDQENDVHLSPAKARTPPRTLTPRRPHGTAVPLGELTLDDAFGDDHHANNEINDPHHRPDDMLYDSSDLEPEYPPSPRKSPSKSPGKSPMKSRAQRLLPEPGESSRDAVARDRNITPCNIFDRTLAADSPYAVMVEESPSPRKARVQRALDFVGKAPVMSGQGLFSRAGRAGSPVQTPNVFGQSSPPSTTSLPAKVTKRVSPSSTTRKTPADKQKSRLDDRLWDLCGRDIQRWNRGDFDGEPFQKRVDRW